MADQIFAASIIEAHPGMENECLALLRDLYEMMGAKGYCRDLLYRDIREPRRFVHLRYWNSEDARDTAHEDPDVHKFWRRLGELCEINHVYERLEQVI